MLPTVGYDLWLLDETKEYAESLLDGRGVVPLRPGPVILRGRYLEERQATADRLQQEWHRLANDDSYLLWVVPSTDGPPHRSVFVYSLWNPRMVEVFRVHEASGVETARPHPTRANRYTVVTEGSPYTWINDYRRGERGFFLTGASPTSDLWRINRMDVDAHKRLLLTLSPVWLALGIAASDFRGVTDPALAAALTEAFQAFQGAVATRAYLSVVSNARAVAECVLWHCLAGAGRPRPDSLYQMLSQARRIMDDPEKAKEFLLKEYGFYLAHRIRLLFQKTHVDRVVQRGEVIRPEVAMSSAIDVSELLVSVGLARY
jgi:hypothetical protein